MRLRFRLFLAALPCLLIQPAPMSALEPVSPPRLAVGVSSLAEGPARIEIDAFPYPMTRIEMESGAGTPYPKSKIALVDRAIKAKQPIWGDEGIMPPDDKPPFTRLVFKNYSEDDPYKTPSYKRGVFFPSLNELTVYTITDVQTAPYKTIQPVLKKWRELLKTRPRSIPGGQDKFPDYLITDRAHLVEARIEYEDYDWGQGCFYMTEYVQDHENLMNPYVYLNFDGLSKDGKYYVKAHFNVMHPKLPDRDDDEPAHPIETNSQADAFLWKQKDDSFTPSIRKIREWIGSLKINPVSTPQ